ncbi:uncharacterized protein KY384_001683 [Bacidia gigantensis]|uniref:uncharacterized protein n=1 Tax=Bacidia gigantensis TaxID=2732470 RepID=UPI001D0549A0|nr:uncharacterized protein KY384_001683 [Bacidia gigantensis]KAG8533942.1 hypothetical protein KY384_001683 [Bacidia gigantensis]
MPRCVSQEAADDEISCICDGEVFDDMICCDQKGCDTQWYHYSCVDIETAPIGEWICPPCHRKWRNWQYQNESERHQYEEKVRKQFEAEVLESRTRGKRPQSNDKPFVDATTGSQGKKQRLTPKEGEPRSSTETMESESAVKKATTDRQSGSKERSSPTSKHPRNPSTLNASARRKDKQLSPTTPASRQRDTTEVISIAAGAEGEETVAPDDMRPTYQNKSGLISPESLTSKSPSPDKNHSAKAQFFPSRSRSPPIQFVGSTPRIRKQSMSFRLWAIKQSKLPLLEETENQRFTQRVDKVKSKRRRKRRAR